MTAQRFIVGVAELSDEAGVEFDHGGASATSHIERQEGSVLVLNEPRTRHVGRRLEAEVQRYDFILACVHFLYSRAGIRPPECDKTLLHFCGRVGIGQS